MNNLSQHKKVAFIVMNISSYIENQRFLYMKKQSCIENRHFLYMITKSYIGNIFIVGFLQISRFMVLREALVNMLMHTGGQNKDIQENVTENVIENVTETTNNDSDIIQEINIVVNDIQSNKRKGSKKTGQWIIIKQEG